MRNVLEPSGWHLPMPSTQRM